MEFHYERVPRWIYIVGAAGTPIAGIIAGPWAALGFALGAIGSWWNYAHLVKAVTTLTRSAAEQTAPGAGRMVAGLFLRIAVVGGGAIVILKYSKVNLMALLVGLFASCIAICVEILYELLWSTSTKSG